TNNADFHEQSSWAPSTKDRLLLQGSQRPYSCVTPAEIFERPAFYAAFGRSSHVPSLDFVESLRARLDAGSVARAGARQGGEGKTPRHDALVLGHGRHGTCRGAAACGLWQRCLLGL